MHALIQAVEDKQRKAKVVDVRSGDVVRVHQKITEGSKSRIQIFEGLVIRAARKNSVTSSIAVRRIASGVGVEKTFLLHSPLVEKVEVVKRSKVRRNYLSYMRARSGKSARLDAVAFNRDEVNFVPDPEAEPVKAEPVAEEAAATEETAEATTDEATQPAEATATEEPASQAEATTDVDEKADVATAEQADQTSESKEEA